MMMGTETVLRKRAAVRCRCATIGAASQKERTPVSRVSSLTQKPHNHETGRERRERPPMRCVETILNSPRWPIYIVDWNWQRIEEIEREKENSSFHFLSFMDNGYDPPRIFRLFVFKLHQKSNNKDIIFANTSSENSNQMRGREDRSFSFWCPPFWLSLFCFNGANWLPFRARRELPNGPNHLFSLRYDGRLVPIGLLLAQITFDFVGKRRIILRDTLACS